MDIKFTFSAFGILAIAALLFVLYVVGQTPQVNVDEKSLEPLLYLGGFIVVMFIFYMFLKLLKR